MFIPNEQIDLYKFQNNSGKKDFVLDTEGLSVYISPLGDEYRAMNNIDGSLEAYKLFCRTDVIEAGDKIQTDSWDEYKVKKVSKNKWVINYHSALIVEQYD